MAMYGITGDMVLREGRSDNVSYSCVALCCSVLQCVAVS